MSKGKWAIVVAVCVALAAVAMAYVAGQARTTAPEVVRAQRFELVDAQGKTCGGLWIGKDGAPRLALGAEASLCGGKDPSLLLLGKSGSSSLACGQEGKGEPSLQLMGEGGMASVDAGKPCGLTVYGKDPTRFLVARIASSGDPELRLMDLRSDGKVLWQAP